jgi:hypothetical protein
MAAPLHFPGIERWGCTELILILLAFSPDVLHASSTSPGGLNMLPTVSWISITRYAAGAISTPSDLDELASTQQQSKMQVVTPYRLLGCPKL